MVEQSDSERTSKGITWENANGRIELKFPENHIIEIILIGNMTMSEGSAYLEKLSEWLSNSRGPNHLLYDARLLKRYESQFVIAHGSLSKQHHDKLGKIAVITSNALGRFAVATVNMAQNLHVYGFSDASEAHTWLKATE